MAKTKKRFIKVKCSPLSRKNSSLAFTCLTDSNLKLLKRKWNKRNSLDKTRQINSDNPRVIWNNLKQKVKNSCNSEACWIRSLITDPKLKNIMLNESFLPKMPDEWNKNPVEWLSSDELNDSMKQYEDAYNEFMFLGPSPIDYDFLDEDGECVWPEICNFNLKDTLKKGKTKIGIIFNLDTHDKGGSHWVSFFLDLTKNNLYYFDSAGSKMPRRLNQLVKNIQRQGLELNNTNILFDQNHPHEHQKKNTECGMYSLYFLINMLKGTRSWEFFKTKVIEDSEMEKYRQIYFNKIL